ncbi:MAG: PIG-L family deacetylase [Chloroflexota bacterium]|nr:PIG-L family deacetylase [Chloroflexota bacterium]
MTNKERQLAIFLSPHFDDIALSCGGTAARMSRMGAHCIGLTVCAAPAEGNGSLSSFAEDLHGKWASGSGTEALSLNDVRREEERQALRLLGLTPVWLDVPDAPYRRGAGGRHLYTSDGDLFGSLAHEESRTLVPHIVSEIKRVAQESGARGHVRVFAPLGLGNHVDHQLVFRTARSLPPRYGVLFYEDYPYAQVDGALQKRLAGMDQKAQSLVTSITELIGIKIAAVARYKSQLGVLFGSPDAMPRAVRAYSESVAQTSGMAGYAERVWRLPLAYTLA